jgi:hypothetical protein
MVLKAEVLTLADTKSGRPSAIIRRHKLSESKVGGARGHCVKKCDRSSTFLIFVAEENS